MKQGTGPSAKAWAVGLFCLTVLVGIGGTSAFGLWEQSSTGPALDEFRQNRAAYAKAVTDSKRSTVATVPDAAVSELDERAGVARVLVGVDVTVTPDGQAPVVTRQRLPLEMTRTDGGWKVSKLNPVRSPTTGSPTSAG